MFVIFRIKMSLSCIIFRPIFTCPKPIRSINTVNMCVCVCVYDLLVEMQRRRIPAAFLADDPAVHRGIVAPKQVAEHQPGQQERRAQRAARYHFRLG